MDKALRQLRQDPTFAPLLKRYGKPVYREHHRPFQALVRSIIYQQVTGKAAASILAKFTALYGEFPTPKQVLATSQEKLRSAGVSPQKSGYILDLAQKFSDGTVVESELEHMSNEEVLAHLTRVKGVGVWTVHMFLIFTLGRLDVLPTGDLGIQKGFKVLYNLRALPTPQKMERLAKPWRQYASVASWYLWRVADEEKLQKPTAVVDSRYARTTSTQHHKTASRKPNQKRLSRRAATPTRSGKHPQRRVGR